jgi:hypothetical protein
MKTYGGVGCSSTILNLGTRWNASVALTPKETAPGARWTGYLMDPTAGLDATEKGYFLLFIGIENRLHYTD